MKVSEIQVSDIVGYIKLETGEYVEPEMQAYIDTSKAFIKAYTGLDGTALDEHDDFVIVVYILCRDMHDNRSLYVDKTNLNKVVDTILSMHCVNLL